MLGMRFNTGYHSLVHREDCTGTIVMTYVICAKDMIELDTGTDWSPVSRLNSWLKFDAKRDAAWWRTCCNAPNLNDWIVKRELQPTRTNENELHNGKITGVQWRTKMTKHDWRTQMNPNEGMLKMAAPRPHSTVGLQECVGGSCSSWHENND
jgi:hypothetical protein